MVIVAGLRPGEETVRVIEPGVPFGAVMAVS